MQSIACKQACTRHSPCTHTLRLHTVSDNNEPWPHFVLQLRILLLFLPVHQCIWIHSYEFHLTLDKISWDYSCELWFDFGYAWLYGQRIRDEYIIWRYSAAGSHMRKGLNIVIAHMRLCIIDNVTLYVCVLKRSMQIEWITLYTDDANASPSEVARFIII